MSLQPHGFLEKHRSK